MNELVKMPLALLKEKSDVERFRRVRELEFNFTVIINPFFEHAFPDNFANLWACLFGRPPRSRGPLAWHFLLVRLGP